MADAICKTKGSRYTQGKRRETPSVEFFTAFASQQHTYQHTNEPVVKTGKEDAFLSGVAMPFYVAF